MDDYDEPNEPESFDYDDDNLDDLVTCVECGSEIYALGNRCPKCGHWMVQEEVAQKVDVRYPHRNIKLVAGCLLIVIVFLLIFGLIVPLFW